MGESVTPPMRQLRDSRFWETKTLAQLSPEEWEALCDRCGLCCLEKLEHEETGEVVYTRAICPLSDPETARCTDYENRHVRVPHCVPLTPERVADFHWLPETCAYRLMHEGQPLPAWHPLISGRWESVFEAGIAVQNWQPVPATAEIDLSELIIELNAR